MIRFTRFGRGASPLPRLALALGLTLSVTACDLDELLEIPDPDIADPRTLADSTALPAFLAGAIGDFSVAFDAGAGDNQANYSGMLADELFNSETFPTRIAVDIRNMEETNSNLQALVRNLYRARTSALEAERMYHQFSPNNIGLAEAYNLAAMSYMLFGENYCSGVPFSRILQDGTFEYGGQNTTAQIFGLAVEAADSALAVATRAVTTTALRNRMLNTARVLRGRALLNLNQPAAAAAAVAAVPTNFEYSVFHSENTARENNGIFGFNTLNERISVANSEGVNGLPYRTNFTNGDWRTPWTRTPATNVGFDNVSPQYNTLKYSTRSDTTPVATGLEARLIEAEAAYRAGNYGGAGGTLAILNALRATPPTVGTSVPVGPALPALADPGTPAGQVDQIFSERAYWMWLTGHRLGDMRRLVRQYGRNQNTVFPVGAYHKGVQGGNYLSDVNFPLSVDERNNPEFEGFPSNQSLCLDRNA